MPQSSDRRAGPPPRAQQLIADDLRARILAGDPAPGTPLREEELSAHYEASRHTVRSALLLLAAERLVRTAPYRGARVARLDDDEVLALQDLRCALESASVRILHRRYGDAWPRSVLRPIEDALEDFIEAEAEAGTGAAADVDPTERALRVSRAHVAFHRAVVDACGSARIIEAYEGIGSEVLLFTTSVRPHYEPGSFSPQHREYLAEVQRGDTEAVWRHLSASSEVLLTSRA